MENYKDYIEKRVEIFPQQFKFGSFIRYEHCLEACKMAVEEALKISSNPVLSDSLPSDVDEFLRCYPEYRCLDVIGKFKEWKLGNV